jgi:ribosomal protein L11 methyltransferase
MADCYDRVELLLAHYGITERRYIVIESQNWNALWESNFPPVEVDNLVAIRAPFHEPYPTFRFDIVITPKMSFGTGHHATTYLMSRAAASRDFTGKRVLDMGCGTGVLAIVALKCGAERMIAVDIDDWACDSCRDSIALSGVAEKVDVRCGSIDVVAGEKFDFILANINRNILQMMMADFAQSLNPNGWIAMSGFLHEDAELVAQSAQEHGLEFITQHEQDGWVVMVCQKM